MGTLTYDCEDGTQGNALSGWDLFEGGGSAYVTESTNNNWTFAPSPGGSRLLYDNTDSGSLTDCVVTMMLRYSDNRAYSFIHCRSNGLTGASADAYVLMFANTVLKIYRRDDGAYTQLDEATITTTSSPATYYHMKMEVSGTTIRGRAWEDGDTEPSTWDVSATDSTYSAGYVLVGGDYTGWYDDIEITWEDPPGELSVVTTHPYPALGGKLGATDRLVCPQDDQTAIHTDDFFSVLRGLTIQADGLDAIGWRYVDTPSYVRLQIDDDGSGALKATGSTRVNFASGTFSDDDDAIVTAQSSDSQVFVNGASAGSTTVMAPTTGTVFNATDLASGLVMDTIEFWPLRFNLFKV